MLIDTHKAVREITAAGLSEPQAEAIVSAMNRGEDQIATKDDLEKLGAELRADMETLRADMETLRTDMETLRTEMEGVRKSIYRAAVATAGTVIAALSVAVAILLNAG